MKGMVATIGYKKLAAVAIFLVLLVAGSVYLYRYMTDKSSNASSFVDYANSNIISSSVSSVRKENAPDFTIYDENGNKVKLSDFLGTPVVINFWASWCPYCVEEMPNFNKAFQDYPDVKFLMIDINDGQRETKDDALTFVREKKYVFPVLFDTDLQASDAFQAYSLPSTFFIDKDGYIIDSEIGAMDADTLNKNIQKLIK